MISMCLCLVSLFQVPSENDFVTMKGILNAIFSEKLLTLETMNDLETIYRSFLLQRLWFGSKG